MKIKLSWLLFAALAAACTFALVSVRDTTVRAAVGVAGLCGLALFAPRRSSHVRKHDPLAAEANPHEVKRPLPAATESPAAHLPDANDVASLVERLIAQGRTALLLRPEVAAGLPPDDLATAEEVIDESMAFVPLGDVRIHPRGMEHAGPGGPPTEKIVSLESFLLDRYPVTNRDFQAFVRSGAYREMSLWEPAIWPAIGQFVDHTGEPGPRFWSHGRYAEELADHPVVGICWFEAVAFARWVGKRLPTDPEWVKAAAWPISVSGERPTQRRYPWGDAMDRRLANLWSSEQCTTPVDQYPDGGTVNGVYDLVGNVWEWTGSSFDEHAPPRLRWETEAPLKSIRGGAFDTYFDTQAATEFASGEDPFARRHNIGFRCAVSLNDLQLSDGRDTATLDAESRETIRFATLQSEAVA